MGITIKDIAKECGVSVATVSMALSDKPSRVSENTKKKVKEYDFRSPKRFTREQLKVIDSIYQNYARRLSSYK